MSDTHPAEPVLIVDDEESIRVTARAALGVAGITNLRECDNGTSARKLIGEAAFSSVILDLSMPGMTGRELLPILLAERPETPVIVATGSRDLETAIECMRNGAFDYLVKPIDKTRLITSVRHAIERFEAQRELSSLRDVMLTNKLAHPERFESIVTTHPSMFAVFRYVEAVGPTSLPVLITGETGTGKELLARCIHGVSGSTGAFVPVNVAGLDDTLFSDTLFGHMKGAYTGADTARDGMVAKAEGGTLFLDEIGDLSAESQIKLLRLLQEHEYYPLGADRPRRTSARVVFATNIDIADAADSGRFRRDLLFRLRSHHIHIPPLRERPSDISILVDHFFKKASTTIGKPVPTIPKELVPLLRSYPFPGNIRELEGLVFDALVRHQSKVLSLKSFRDAIGARDPSAGRSGDSGSAANVFEGCIVLPTLKEANAMLIEESLKRASGNQEIAARMVGLTRTALNRRVNKEV